MILDDVDVNEVATPKVAELTLDKLEWQAREVAYPSSNRGLYKKKQALNNNYDKLNNLANMRRLDTRVSDKEKALWTAIAKRCTKDREKVMAIKEMKFEGTRIY